MVAVGYRKQMRAESENKKEKEDEYLMSDIIKGFTHLYVENGKKSEKLCSEETVKTENLKELVADISEMENKICSECLEEYNKIKS